LFLLTTSCEYDHYDAQTTGDGMAVELSIRTRAISSTSYTYEVGTQWENYIDIAGGDYRIYFFTNDKDDANATDDSGRNTLIAEFLPTDLTAVEGAYYTQYTLSGKVGDDIAAYSDFKVVVLANWGAYPEVTTGTTTIDDIVEGENSTFTADTFLNGVDSSHLIPFYGVREYSGVEWRNGWRITLEGNITLLRAIAKVEVVMSGDSEIETFDSVSIVRYNTSGYCAPARVYLKSDYDHDQTWEEDFTDGIHLVGGGNDASGESAPLTRQSTTDSDVWTIYLPEYDNTSNTDDYSYIQISVDDVEYQVYFSNYSDGITDSTADYDIFRNYLYRFNVTYLGGNFVVRVEKWSNAFDNEWTFGDMDGPEGSGEPMADGTRFYYDGLEYAVVSSADRTIEVTYINSSSITTYWGTIEIPETVLYDGVTYIVIGIAEGTFDNGAGITSVTIPATVTYIGGYAFENCTNMVSITCLNPEPPECENYAFYGADTDVCILYVPDDSISVYAETVPWNSFVNIKGVSEKQ
ncbi:MAG: leucine-rich repeat domain-containing protein, partial [Bacteroidales bacterium]|nr:leucine-rich repeat domain-containing protein [Bacteroidales bacterium]